MASNISVGLRLDRSIEEIKNALTPVVNDLGIEGVTTNYNGVSSSYSVLPDSSMLSPKHANAPTSAYVALLEIVRVQSFAIATLHQRVSELETKISKGGKK